MPLQMTQSHSIFMAELHFTIYTYHIFIHSSVDGRLGCFHVLVVINTTAMNTGVHGVGNVN